MERFIKLMRAYQLLLELYEVDAMMAVATSAMREATNGAELVHTVKLNTGLEINIIDGEEEADMINDAIYSYITKGPALHIDVGGGSTELNLYLNHRKIRSVSFAIGSVRRIEVADTPETWSDIKKWIKRHVTKDYAQITALGTGGNINKLYEITAGRHNLGKTKSMTLDQARDTYQYLQGFSTEELESGLQLNADRADVIIPASEIYLNIMKWAGANTIRVPDVGLKDGIMQHLYRSNLIE